MCYPQGDGCDRLRLMAGVVLVRVRVVTRGLVRLLVDVDAAGLWQGGDMNGEGIATVVFNGVCRICCGMNESRLCVQKVIPRTCYMGFSFDEDEVEQSGAVVEGII